MAKSAEVKVKISSDGGSAAASDINKVEKAAGTAGTGLAGLVGHSGKLTSALGSELKGATEEAGGGLSGLGAAAGPVGLGIAAVGGFALEGVSKFENLGVAVGQFKDATGLSADESSRWIEVAKDHGIASDALESSIGKMEKALGKNGDAFKQYGVETARAKDGTLDANATFLNAVDALNKMQDPTARATAGAAIFGKSWQGMSEIIGDGAPKLRADLASVQPSAVFNDGDISSAKNVRDAFDQIKDAGEGLLLTIGKALAPVIATLAPKFSEIITAAGPLVKLVGDTLATAFEDLGPVLDGVVSILGPLAKALGFVTQAIPALVEGVNHANLGLGDQKSLTKEMLAQWDQVPDKYKKYGMSHAALRQELDAGIVTIGDINKIIVEHGNDLDGMTGAIAPAVGATTDLTVATSGFAAAAIHSDDIIADLVATQADAKQTTADLEAAFDLQATATATATKDLNDHITALTTDMAAQRASIDAQRAAADSTFALNKATQEYSEADKTLSDALQAAKGDTGAITVAFDQHTQSALAVADATGQVFEKTIEAAGGTETATQKMDTFNHSLVDQATSKIPGANDAIADYIIKTNEIPEDKATEIKAAIAAGDLETAKALIDDASKTRTASLVVDADNASIADANRQIQAGIDHNIKLTPIVAGSKYAAGTDNARAGLALVGEDGPELVELAGGETIHNTARTKGMLSAPTPVAIGGGGGGTMNVFVQMPNGYSDPVAWAKTKVQLEKRGGNR